MAQVATLNVDQGATFNALITLTIPSGAAYDLTGYSARMQVRAQFGSPVLTELNTTNNELAVGGSAGTVAIAWSASSTAALPCGGKIASFLYDIVITSPSGQVTRVLQGNVAVSPGVTL